MCGLHNYDGADIISDCTESNDRTVIDNELQMMWKEAIVTKLRYYGGICLVGLRNIKKTPVKLCGFRAEKRNGYFINTCHKLLLL
jgi:hypothetical protein